MSDLEQTIQRVLDLDAQATQGPWRAETVEMYGPVDCVYAVGPLHEIDDNDAAAHSAARTDADLIAEYRTVAPALARALLAALKENARLRAVLAITAPKEET